MKMNFKNNQMLTGPVIQTYYLYSVPWVFALVLNSSAGLFDGIFVGRYVGATGLAAINLVLPVMQLLSGVGVVLAVGGSVRYAAYVGQNNLSAASAVFTKTLLVIIAACGVIQLACLLAGESVVKLLGSRDELLVPS